MYEFQYLLNNTQLLFSLLGCQALKLAVFVAVAVTLLIAAVGQPSAVPADVVTAVVPPVAAGCQLPTLTISPYPSFCYFCLPDEIRVLFVC